jgi:uncharacterized membrane protein YccC
MIWNRVDTGRFRGAASYAFRLSAAALLALWLAYRLKVTLPLWSALTALVVTQISIGRSVRATMDYFAATIGGVLWGGLVAVLVPHSSETELLLVLLLALAPLAFIAALYPRFAVGPVTAAIVVLVPDIMHTTPIASALDRVIEVSLGGLAGLFVSFVLVPSSAFRHTREVAARATERMAKAIPELIEGFENGLTEADAHRIQDGIGQELNDLSTVVAEAEHERPLRLSDDPLTGPLFRTLLRLRHDLVIVGRAAQAPLPVALAPDLLPSLITVGKEAASHLQVCAVALMSRQTSPSRAALDSALARYTGEIDGLRREGRLRELTGEAVERVFATGFALEQMRHNLGDLDRCVAEWAKRRE